MTIQEYNDIYKNSITKSMQIESSGGVTITNTNICSEQMSLEEALCSEENLIIGSCESSCFKIRIADMNHNFEGETLTVYQMIMVDAGNDLLLESGNSDYILLENGDNISLEMVGVPVPYGKFKVLSDKPTNDRRWRDLTCYDAMYDILNADVAEWYNSLTFPMTIKNFRDRFFNYLGITQDTVTLVNDNFEIQGGFSVSGALSGKDVITSICELNGVFGHISRDGLFEYISLPSVDSLALDWYIDGTGAYEDYLVQKITGIVARSSEDDAGTTVGTDTNLYVVEDNPLIYGSEGTASLTTALTNLLNNVKDINYRPFNVDTYGNPMLPLGTNLTITTRNQTINSFLMTRVLSGIQSLKDSISAKGEKYRPTEVNSLRSETKRTKGIIHELINDVDELRSTITDLDNQTSSEIQQLSDEIVLKVDASGNIVKVALASNASEGSTFAVNADNIRFTAGSVMRFDANNIVINSTYFKVDQYGNLESTSGKIGGWYIRSGGLSNGMTTATNFANTGIFLSSAGRIVINDANTHTNSVLDKDMLAIIRNDIGNGAYVGYISNSVGFGFQDAYGNPVSFRGTALKLGCVKDGTSAISNVRLKADPSSIILYGGDTGYANKIISLFGGFRDNSWTNEKVTYVDTYKGLQTCDTTKTEVEYVHGVTSNIQTQLNGKQATITGGATTIVSDNLTASKALVSNANGKVAVSNVTATELGYVSGATSNIQGQIDGLGAKSVSGNPVVITDAEAMNADHVVATITPTQTGSGTPSPTNVRPIVGFSSVDVSANGKNILRNEKYVLSTKAVFLGSSTSDVEYYLPSGTYAFSVYYASGVSATDKQICYAIQDDHIQVSLQAGLTSATITLEESGYYRFWIYCRNNDASSAVDHFQLEVGDQVTAYEPYQGQTYTVQLGDTYYQGEIDLTSGVLRASEKYKVIDGSYNWGNATDGYYLELSASGLSDMKIATSTETHMTCNIAQTNQPVWSVGCMGSENGTLWFTDVGRRTYGGYQGFKTFLNGTPMQIVYELATPIEIQLTPTQIALLENSNTITTNVSSLDITYQTNTSIGDTASALDKRVTSLESTQNYSLSEQKTGKYWIDGKPIYQKTFNLTMTEEPSTSHSFEKNVDVTDLNIDMMISIEGVWRRTVSGGWNAYYQLGGNESGYGDSCGRLSNDKKTITLLFKTEGTDSQIFTIKYTKAS